MEPCSQSYPRSSSARSGSFSEVAAARCWRPHFRSVGIGLLGVSLAFGLTVLTGPTRSGRSPADTSIRLCRWGLWAGGRFPAAHLLPYIVAQVAGAWLAPACSISSPAGRRTSVSPAASPPTDTRDHSPGGYSMVAGLVTEVVMTFMFLIVILGATHKRAPVGFAGLAIGLALTLIHLISIPVTNTSVNPARSTGPALFVGGWAVQQLWLFWIAPLLGAAAAGFMYRALLEGPVEAPPVIGRPVES